MILEKEYFRDRAVRYARKYARSCKKKELFCLLGRFFAVLCESGCEKRQKLMCIR